ncbi:MAG: AAA family ATPase [Thermoproteus sp.]
MKISVKNLKNIEEANVEGEKIVLYGPNGVGKSTLMHLTMLIASKLSSSELLYDEDVLPQYIFNGAEVEFSIGDITGEVKNRKITVRQASNGVSDDLLSGNALRLGDWSIWHIDEYNIEFSGVPRKCKGFGVLELRSGFKDFAVLCPALAQEMGIEGNVHYDATEIAGKWIPIRGLSYGQKKFLAIQAAIYGGDFIFVENFEAGLHVDYITSLLDAMTNTNAVVMIETHSGIVVKYALMRGFSVYKAESGRFMRINFNELSRYDLFQREYQVLQSLI